MLKIKSSLDWYRAEAELQNLSNLLPMFKADLNKIIKNLSVSVKELSQMEVEARNTRSKKVIEKCNIKIQEINDELKKVHNYHLLSLLSNGA